MMVLNSLLWSWLTRKQLEGGLMGIGSFWLAIRWASSDTPIYFLPLRWLKKGTKMTDLTDFLIGCAFLASALFAYGVYRTILAARKDPDVK